MSAENVEASFEIAYMIATEKKSHNNGETLIKPCMLKVVGLALEKTYSKKIAKISLSDFMIKTHIDKVAKEIECQVFKKLAAFFNLI